MKKRIFAVGGVVTCLVVGYFVLVDASDHGPSVHPVVRGGESATEPWTSDAASNSESDARREIRSEVVTTGTIRGVLRRIDGRLLTGVEIHVASSNSTEQLELNGGAFSETLPAGDYELRVCADECRDEVQSFTVVPGRVCDLVVTLHAGATVSGRVTSSNGHSVAGAAVRIESADGQYIRHTAADPWGKFEVSGLPTGQLECAASHESLGSAEATLIADGLGPHKCVLRLVSEFAIEGVVLASDWLPVREPVRVICSGSFPPTSAIQWFASCTTVEGSGMFRLESVPAGVDLNITVSRGGYQLASVDKFRVGKQPIERLQIEVDLQPGACRVAGTVVDSAGQPVSGGGATLTLRRIGSGTAPLLRIHAGQFEVEVPHGQYQCYIRLSGHQRYSGEVFDTRGRSSIDLGTISLVAK